MAALPSGAFGGRQVTLAPLVCYDGGTGGTRVGTVLRKLTSDEFLQISGPDHLDLELSEGEIRVLTKPGPEHQRVVARLWALLDEWVTRHRWGRVYIDTLVRLSDVTSRAPDLSAVRTDRLHVVGTARLNEPPDLAVEVHSENRSEDRGPKFEEYQRAGVPYYWMIDPASRSLEAYALDGGRYRLEWQGRDGDVFEPRIFPGLRFSLDRLWLESES